MNRRILATAVALAATAGLLAWAPAAVAAPRPAAPDAPSSSGSVRAELESLYESMHAVVANGVAAGAPVNAVAPPISPAAFEAQLALVTDEDLAPFAAMFRRTAVIEDYESLAASTTPASRRRGAATGRSERIEDAGLQASSLAIVVPDPPDLEPPSPPFAPSSPVVPTETLTCPEVPPGRDWGTFAVFTSEVTASAVGAIAEALPASFDIVIPVIAGVAITFTLPSPLKIVAQVAKGLADVATHTLNWLKDRYGDCGGIDLFAAGPNIENSAIQLYGITSRANEMINTVNEGLIALSDQAAVMQSSLEELQTVRIQQALAAPTTAVANVAYVLPASEGGYLNASPVGVRSVVEQTLAAARAARLPVSAAAIIYQAQANLALALQNYAAAYRAYQRTYQAIGR